MTDAGVAWAVDTMDLRLCLIGADAVLRDGTVLTSPGALTIALVGRRRGIPVYAVTDLWKLMDAVSPELAALNEVDVGRRPGGARMARGRIRLPEPARRHRPGGDAPRAHHGGRDHQAR